MCGIPNLLAVSFQPTRPYGARLRQLANPDKLVVVSTHAPLWGATSRRAGWLDGSAWFQPTRPYGARQGETMTVDEIKRFNPRAPMGRDCRFMHNSESNCMIYAIFKLPQNPPSNHRPEMTRFMREPHVWIPIAWGSRTSRSRAPKLIVNLEFTQVHYRKSKNVRARITQKEATPAHRLPYQHGIPNPIPLRPFGHGATAPRRPYCT